MLKIGFGALSSEVGVSYFTVFLHVGYGEPNFCYYICVTMCLTLIAVSEMKGLHICDVFVYFHRVVFQLLEENKELSKEATKVLEVS